MAIPRWARRPVAGVGEYETELSGVPGEAEARAAHARVLDALTGESATPEVELDQPWGTGLPEGIVLSVRFERDWLRLRYRTEVVDAEYAARIAGYYLSALARNDVLLSEEELAYQVDGLAGPRRERPNQRFHELFEQRAREQPDAIAAVHGGRRLTYRELNRRANRIGRELLARDIGREDIVAVMTERSLDWMAAVIAVFKAGGVYLPIEPHFPADRIAAMVSRSGCRLALADGAVVPGVDTLSVGELLAGNGPDDDLGVRVAADQLAYIYFTSGSTGEPKGAMCEHAGMLNHLCAKAEDLEIGPDDVVAQTAPQCFDISLWQLVCAPLTGGRTVIFEQEAILDVERLVDKLVDERVSVWQVVPSYLDVVLSYLDEHPRELTHLRRVVVTGEEVKKELVRRWFTVNPGIALVNAYGLTETSDDTNHEVMHRVPDRDRIPLGPAVANALVYVVDDNLWPVPLGAPGEIVFSGVCVGRGYVNDPERTRAAFTTDPHRPGQRLYRSGDRGRWLPDGKLEFLGRADSQVKIRGFRIELGEIENRLLGLSAVRDGAVVVAERADGRRLVAFYRADSPVPANGLRVELARTLPEYMVPSALHWRESLPLTANGKIDKKALARLAAELDPFVEGTLEPETPTQRRLAVAWSQVLRIPIEHIGRSDHFFDRGGTSLAAVRVAIALGRLVSPKDMIQNPVLADLATVVDRRASERRS